MKVLGLLLLVVVSSVTGDVGDPVFRFTTRNSAPRESRQVFITDAQARPRLVQFIKLEPQRVQVQRVPTPLIIGPQFRAQPQNVLRLQPLSQPQIIQSFQSQPQFIQNVQPQPQIIQSVQPAPQIIQSLEAPPQIVESRPQLRVQPQQPQIIQVETQPQIVQLQQQLNTQRTYASAYTGPQYRIIKQVQEIDPAGNYRFNFITENGIVVKELGIVTNPGTQAESTAKQGSYTYTGDDGQVYTVDWVADDDGYRASGAHLPTPPPIPEAILRSLEENANDSTQYDEQGFPIGRK